MLFRSLLRPGRRPGAHDPLRVRRLARAAHPAGGDPRLGELYRMGGVPPERQNEVMGRIEDEASRMGRLVEDLLQLARIDEGRKMTMERVDLTAVCSGASTKRNAPGPPRPVRDDRRVFPDAFCFFGPGFLLFMKIGRASCRERV